MVRLMGQMADFAVGQITWGKPRRSRSVRYKTCRYCGLGGLHWESPVAGSWRLYNSLGDLHECDQKRINSCRCTRCRGCNLQPSKR